jgi:hypothetical protein
MEKLPEKIYLQDGLTPYPDTNLISSRAYSSPTFEKNVEYIRGDIAEKMAKEFSEWLWRNAEPNGEGLYETWGDNVMTLDELFTEFANPKGTKIKL